MHENSENSKDPVPLIPRVDFLDIFPNTQINYNIAKRIALSNLEFTSGNINVTELMYLALITHCIRPMAIVEFGTFNGRSTSVLALNSDDRSFIVTVDLPRKQINETKYELERKQFDPNNDELGFVGIKDKQFHGKDFQYRIHQIWDDTANFPIKTYKESIDLFFIDASHSYANCKNDFRTALKCIKPDGVIILHDYAGWPGVTQALNEYYYDEDIPLRWLNGTSFAILNSGGRY